jgi:acyl-CoA synthetase (AMP-forming)/AMP-acid ligase II
MIAVAEIIARDPQRPPTGAALARHCRAELAGYKVPTRFEMVDALPRTANGKLRR